MENKENAIITGLSVLCIVAHTTAKDKGFHDRPLNVGEQLALIHSEISEALEAHRTNSKDQHLPQYDGITVELADAIIRIAHLAERLNLPLAEATVSKMQFNDKRPHKHGKDY